MVALDADTGKLKWHYQFTPHDELDYDSTQVPLLADIQWRGKPRKVMLWANRNGLMYVLDRVTGEFLQGKPYVKVNWMDGFDAKGRPQRVPGMVPTKEGTVIQPHVHGATNWAPPSFSPRTGCFYVAHWENSGTVLAEGLSPRARGAREPDGADEPAPNSTTRTETAYGVVRAPRPADARAEVGVHDERHHVGRRADHGRRTCCSAAARKATFFALDARTGALLWKVALGGQINSGPMSYAVNGRQYVTVAAGTASFAFALKQ